MDQPNKIQCINCQTVTTSDGKTVWVCENCGEVNQPVAADSTNPVVDTPVSPVPPVEATPEVPAVDVSTAQAELDKAASQLGNQPTS